jgi:ubiquinol-cytochrome c reductase iron-sulfur subunit
MAPDSERAARRIGVAFVVSALASVGLTVVYALGGQPQIEGALIGLSLGGLSIGFVLWGKHLLPQGPYAEEREPLGSTPVERAAVARDVRRGERVSRRRFLRGSLGAALAALAAALVLPIRSLGPSPGRSLFRTAWTRGARLVTPEGSPVTEDSLLEGGVLTVFPEGHTEAADSQAILIRVDPQDLALQTGQEAWTPQGYGAFSKICTHAGCPVGLYEHERKQLFCPCHQSAFDVLQGARPVSGPATRALPQLPLEIDDEGYVRALGDFPAPVGPSFWTGP